jgi:hypothetical protein
MTSPHFLILAHSSLLTLSAIDQAQTSLNDGSFKAAVPRSAYSSETRYTIGERHGA